MFRNLLSLLLNHYYLGKLRSWLVTFTALGQSYHYFCHRYNATWRNERTVEVPIMLHAIRQYSSSAILEVGNVLAHYVPIRHQVVDKYEKAPGVINQDIITFKPRKKYDLIVSISTLEHVGFDEKPKQPQKPLRAIQALQKLLTKKGKLIVTIPVGYNPHLDVFLEKKRLVFDEVSILQRISADNGWREITTLPSTAKYGQPYANANVVVIGVMYGKGK